MGNAGHGTSSRAFRPAARPASPSKGAARPWPRKSAPSCAGRPAQEAQAGGQSGGRGAVPPVVSPMCGVEAAPRGRGWKAVESWPLQRDVSAQDRIDVLTLDILSCDFNNLFSPRLSHPDVCLPARVMLRLDAPCRVQNGVDRGNKGGGVETNPLLPAFTRRQARLGVNNVVMIPQHRLQPPRYTQ